MIYNIDIEVVWKYYNETLLSLSHVSAFMKQVHVLLCLFNFIYRPKPFLDSIYY